MRDTAPYNFHKFIRPPRFSSKPFDRKTFNPVNNPQDRATLGRLRTQGGARFFHWGWEKWMGDYSRRRKLSSSMDLLPFSYADYAGKTFVDAGCGDSADADIFAENGGNAFVYDLFPRKESYDFPNTITKVL